MLFVGDKSQFYNSKLEEPDTSTYICPFCGNEKDVSEEYDLLQKMFFPVRFADTICSKCDEAMDRNK